MYGRSQYETRGQYAIGIPWLFFAILLFAGGMVAFVIADTMPSLLGSWLIWMCGLILAGMWVEWWSR